MGTHGLLRLFSPPSINRTLRFLSRAASRPATTQPQEPPIGKWLISVHVLPLVLILPPATIISTSSGIVMMGGGVQRCVWEDSICRVVLVGCLRQVARYDRSIIYETLKGGEAPPSAIWICGEMGTSHKL